MDIMINRSLFFIAKGPQIEWFKKVVIKIYINQGQALKGDE